MDKSHTFRFIPVQLIRWTHVVICEVLDFMNTDFKTDTILYWVIKVYFPACHRLIILKLFPGKASHSTGLVWQESALCWVCGGRNVDEQPQSWASACPAAGPHARPSAADGGWRLHGLAALFPPRVLHIGKTQGSAPSPFLWAFLTGVFRGSPCPCDCFV